MNGRGGLLTRLDDWVNPIVVKELRQAVNSKFVASTLVLLLAFQLSALGLFLISGGDFSTSVTSGRDAFLILQAILLAACVLFVPAYTGARLAFERSDGNVDLLFITTIKPSSIVGGKIFSALTITMLIFSACMPFMVFTYWLRGIDIPSIFIMLALCFLEVAVCINLATFVACLPSGRILKGLLSIALFLLFFVLFWTTVGYSYALIRTGIGSKIDKWTFWEPATIVLLITGALMGLLFCLSIALLTPVSANRARPVRLFLTTTWLASGVITAIISFAEKSRVPLAVWGILSAVVFSGAMFVAVSERLKLGARVARSIPTSVPLRLLAFLYFSGAARGICWAIIQSLLTLAAFKILTRTDSLRVASSADETTIWIIGLPLYAFCYSLSALLIRRKLLSRWLSEKYTWAVGVILLAAGCVVPFLIGFLAFFGNLRKMEEIGGWLALNPFALGIRKYQWTYILVAGVWAALVAALNAGWFLDQVRDFRPLESAEAE